MWSWSKGRSRSENTDPGREQRRSERIQTAVLTCSLGPIVEVSRHGVRIRQERRPALAIGMEIDLELAAPTDSVGVRGRVARISSVGGGRYEIGIEFVGLTEEDGGAIESLARTGKRRSPGIFNNEARREKLIAALKLPDYYRLLGVSRDATLADVQRAYRALARTCHPDVCREEGAEKRFVLINEAHATLVDEQRRREYDELFSMRRAA